MAEWIKKNEIGWIAIERSAAPGDFAHNRVLREMLQSGLLGASLVLSVHSERGRDEDLDLYALPAVHAIPTASDEIFLELKPSHQF